MGPICELGGTLTVEKVVFGCVGLGGGGCEGVGLDSCWVLLGNG